MHELDIQPNPDLCQRMSSRMIPKDIGTLKVVFSLRRSIADMARHYREGTRARDVPHMKDGALPEIINVRINVEKCENLKVHYDPRLEVCPFFYYRFYTFDDFISMSQRSSNPTFSDPKVFQITLNDQTKRYLRNERLEIFFVDENGPQAGIGRGKYSEGATGDEDLIGRIEVPLDRIAEKEEIKSEVFIVRDLK